MQKLSTLKIILITPIFFLVASYLAAFPHEYAHATVAWLGGYKENPFAIQYGGISWSNLLFLSNIDENVNYQVMLAAGHPFLTALTAFAGPGIITVSFYLISLYLLTS